MDQFPDRQHVCLRSVEHGTYLHADDDGHGVSLSSLRDSMRAAWAVHRYGDAHHVLLHSAAYGRYLASSPASSAPLGCPGFRVELRDYDELHEATIRWNPHNVGSHIHLRQFAGGRYRYLRAHGRLNPLNADVVSADLIDNGSPFFQWAVERIPGTERVPRLPSPTRVTSVDATLPCSSQTLVITVEPPGNMEAAAAPPAVALSVLAHPCDFHLLQHYLLPTVAGGSPSVAIPIQIHAADVYGRDPEELTAGYAPVTSCDGETRWYFYSTLREKSATDKRTRRRVTLAGAAGADGTWHGEHREKPVIAGRNGVKVGFQKTLTWSRREAGKRVRLGWLMSELRLGGEGRARLVLCKIYRSPRVAPVLAPDGVLPQHPNRSSGSRSHSDPEIDEDESTSSDNDRGSFAAMGSSIVEQGNKERTPQAISGGGCAVTAERSPVQRRSVPLEAQFVEYSRAAPQVVTRDVSLPPSVRDEEGYWLCKVEGCGRRFATGGALGGHMAGSRHGPGVFTSGSKLGGHMGTHPGKPVTPKKRRPKPKVSAPEPASALALPLPMPPAAMRLFGVNIVPGEPPASAAEASSAVTQADQSSSTAENVITVEPPGHIVQRYPDFGA